MRVAAVSRECWPHLCKGCDVHIISNMAACGGEYRHTSTHSTADTSCSTMHTCTHAQCMSNYIQQSTWLRVCTCVCAPLSPGLAGGPGQPAGLLVVEVEVGSPAARGVGGDVSRVKETRLLRESSLHCRRRRWGEPDVIALGVWGGRGKGGKEVGGRGGEE